MLSGLALTAVSNSSLWAALVPLLVVSLGIVVWALIDLARAERVRGLPKWGWALIICFVSIPIGAIVFLVVGRDRSKEPPRPAR